MDGWAIYLVECGDGSLYCGIARDLLARVDAHNAGRGARYTRARRPVRPVYAESVATRSDAQVREHQIKRLTRAEKLVLVQGGPPALDS